MTLSQHPHVTKGGTGGPLAGSGAISQEGLINSEHITRVCVGTWVGAGGRGHETVCFCDDEESRFKKRAVDTY